MSDCINKYRDFIFEGLDLNQKVLLYKIILENGEMIPYTNKLGLNGKIPVKFSNINFYSRSIGFTIKFEDYTEQFIFYISRKHGPEYHFNKFSNKLIEIVNDVLMLHKRIDIYEKYAFKFTKPIKIKENEYNSSINEDK